MFQPSFHPSPSAVLSVFRKGELGEKRGTAVIRSGGDIGKVLGSRLLGKIKKQRGKKAKWMKHHKVFFVRLAEEAAQIHSWKLAGGTRISFRLTVKSLNSSIRIKVQGGTRLPQSSWGRAHIGKRGAGVRQQHWVLGEHSCP